MDGLGWPFLVKRISPWVDKNNRLCSNNSIWIIITPTTGHGRTRWWWWTQTTPITTFIHPPKNLLKHDEAEEVLEWRWKLLKYSIFAHKNSKPATIRRRRWWWWDWGEGAGRNRQRRHIIEIIARHSRLGHKKYPREQQSLIHYILRRSINFHSIAR